MAPVVFHLGWVAWRGGRGGLVGVEGGGGSGQLHTPASLFPVMIENMTGWVPESLWSFWREHKSIDLQESNH